MFTRSFRSRKGPSQGGSSSGAGGGSSGGGMDAHHRVDKAARLTKRTGTGGGGGGGVGGTAGSVRDPQKLSKLQRSLSNVNSEGAYGSSQKSLAPSPIVTLTVGREARLFAAHEDVLCQSPFFGALCQAEGFLDAVNGSKRISLPEEEPEVFSAVLEYLYKGDYYPRLMHNRHRNSWELEDSALPSSSRHTTPNTSPNPNNTETTTRGGRSSSRATTTAVEATVWVSEVGQHLLRDTVIYCAAERYGLEELKRLSLRKQGLQSGIDVGTILRSAQYTYAHTPDSDSRLRAHYLALIIRCRRTFKRSGTMQAEMEGSCGTGGAEGSGGSKLFFDLFVALCNHLDDVIDAGNAKSPRMI